MGLQGRPNRQGAAGRSIERGKKLVRERGAGSGEQGFHILIF
jgi:hypothetical protein